MKESNFIIRMADKFHKNQLLRFFFLKPYRYYKRKVSKSQKEDFHKYSLKVLTHFNYALNQIGCDYWLEFGTLIGAIRENGFIKHDDDIDVGMFLKDRPADFKEQMKKYGFKRHRYIQIDNGEDGFEETYAYQGIHIDIFYFNQSEKANEIYCYDFVKDPSRPSREFMDEVGGFWSRKITLPFTGLTDRDFLGIKVKVPTNYDEHLKANYGNYMEPDPTWNTSKSRATKLMKDKIGKVFYQ